MSNKPPPFEGLTIRIPVIVPSKRRGSISHGFTLEATCGRQCVGLYLGSRALPGMTDSSVVWLDFRTEVGLPNEIFQHASRQPKRSLSPTNIELRSLFEGQ